MKYSNVPFVDRDILQGWFNALERLHKPGKIRPVIRLIPASLNHRMIGQIPRQSRPNRQYRLSSRIMQVPAMEFLNKPEVCHGQERNGQHHYPGYNEQ